VWAENRWAACGGAHDINLLVQKSMPAQAQWLISIYHARRRRFPVKFRLMTSMLANFFACGTPVAVCNGCWGRLAPPDRRRPTDWVGILGPRKG
jgi:hypothetical protein